METTKQHFQVGLLFSTIAVLCWGVLPIAIKLTMNFTDATTLTWIRFAVALVVTFFIQWLSGSLNQMKNLNIKDCLYLTIAGLFLIINYNTFVWSLDYIPPGSAQLNFQIAPFYLAIGGVIFHKDKIRLKQWLCFSTLAIGMLLFFHPSISIQSDSGSDGIFMGVALVQLSAMSWSIFALLQKSLSKKVSPFNILLLIYLLGTIVMAPFIELKNLLTIDNESILLIAFCALNTLVAYGSFVQAMKYWQTVQVSAMIALTPIATMLATTLCVMLNWWPETIVANSIDALSLFGIVIVIISAITVQFFSLPNSHNQTLTVKRSFFSRLNPIRK